MKYGTQKGNKKIAYIDSIDFENEVEGTETTLYPDHESVPENHCARKSCGIYKVSIEAIEYIPFDKIGKTDELPRPS